MQGDPDFRTALRDAEFHANNLQRALERAADCAKQGRNMHFAQQHAGLVRKLAKRIKHHHTTTKGE